VGRLLSCRSGQGILLMALRHVMNHGSFANLILIICSHGAKSTDSKRKTHQCRPKSCAETFFISPRVTTLDTLPNDGQYIQKYFINNILLHLCHKKKRFRREHRQARFVIRFNTQWSEDY
jgi:hypothetical protein